MGKEDIPYLWVVHARGHTYRYYRRNGKVWGKLEGSPGSHEFATSLIKAEAAFYGKPRSPDGTLAALAEEYLASTDFTFLAPSTRASYRRNIDALVETFGDHPTSAMGEEHAFKYRDTMKAEPGKANVRIKVLKLLYAFGITRRLVTTNPLLGIKRLPIGEYLPWPDPIIQHFRDHAPIEMVWAMDLAIYTGQRQGDLLGMAWNHYDGTGVEVVQAKTGARLWIPVHPQLKLTLESIARFDTVTILNTASGRPWRRSNFGEQFHAATRDAGIKGYVFHGLRKTAAVRLAEAGCSEHEIMSITGHRSSDMVKHYTKGARQRVMATAAIAKLGDKK